ncbi:ATP-binding cassette, subfamily B [Pilibacter termitis]|uniref:ATP-binding cassette, subfamily B n=2 Tax=Pilibacter termitis TaxID=263852 RepID=A0A1T4QW38_9ENTE|nr:ATP-binding cassette, subfamily B [Pilibacter termitis]
MKVREIIGTDAYGTSVHGLLSGAEKLGFQAKAVKIKIEEIDSEYSLPAIAHVITESGLNHFVVIYRIKNGKFLIGDPAKELVELDKEEMMRQFTGVLLLLVPKSEFETNYQPKTSMWQLFKMVMYPQKKLLFTVILCSFALTILGIVSSLFSKVVFDEIIPYQLKKTLYLYLIVFGFVGIVQIFLEFFRTHVLLFLSRKIDIPVLLGYYNHVLRLPYQFFATRRVGDILTRFQDAMTIKDIFSKVSISLVLDLTLAIFTGIALMKINLQLFSLTLIVVLCNILLIYLFKKSYKRINYEQMEAGAVMNSQLIESIRNIESVKGSVSETAQINLLESKFVKVLKLGYEEGKLSNLQNVISSGIQSLSGIFMIAFGAIAIIDGKLSLGDLIVFQTLSGYFTEPIHNLVSLQLTYQEAQIAMNRLSELMDLETEENTKHDLLSDIDLMGKIEFQNVTFRYGSRPPVIQNFSLSLEKGQRVAIVGESGAGKSTIAKLLLKFQSNEAGRLTINHYDIEDIQTHYLRGEIGYVPQNVELFTGTIYDNIRMGDEEATYEQVIKACRLAGCHEFIQKLPNRYYAFIEENGANFSGGERQRIAIARAFLKQRQLYIFDESTSNLDSFSERYIQKAMLQATNEATTIIIAHRLSTIVHCDLIVFMEDGKIIEQGSHEELMSLNGRYAEMIQLQYGTRIVKKETKQEIEQEEITYYFGGNHDDF